MSSSFQRLLFGFAACAIAVLLPLTALAEERFDSRVEIRGDIPTLVVNGHPHSGVCYSSYDCSPENLARRVRQFADAGCDIFNFVMEISGYGFSRPMWVGKGQWDFSELDQRAPTILSAAPGALLIPRIYIDAPAWWREENPDEMMVLSNGSTSFDEKLFALPRASDFPSLASRKWRTDMKHALGAVIDHIERSEYSKRVIGYQLSSQKTEEWYHWSMNTELLGDYSSHMRRAFREWLRAQYETDEKLQKAWGWPTVTLDSAEIPSQKEVLLFDTCIAVVQLPARVLCSFLAMTDEDIADDATVNLGPRCLLGLYTAADADTGVRRTGRTPVHQRQPRPL